jgi:hypothetical protein
VLARILDTPKKRIAVAIMGFVLLIGAVAVFALGGDEKEAAPTTTTTTTEAPTTTTVAPTVAPLTGLPGEYQGRLDRRALVVKIDNVEPKSRPQAGLNQADIVFEERVEGSVTRLLAVFHSTDAAPIGPVRSARSSDIAIVEQLNRPFFAWSGANSTFARRIRNANLIDIGYDVLSSEYFREPGRRAPDNLMLKSSVKVMAVPGEGGGPPLPLFKYRPVGEAATGLEPVKGVRITFGSSAGSAPVEFRWNGTGWARTQAGTPHVDTKGKQVAPANVIIQFVPYKSSGVNDQFGVPIPEASLIGSGDVWVLTSGGLIPGHWKKPNSATRTRYTDLNGQTIALTPGQTWVELPAPGGATKL